MQLSCLQLNCFAASPISPRVSMSRGKVGNDSSKRFPSRGCCGTIGEILGRLSYPLALHLIPTIKSNVPATGFLLMTVSECCRPACPLGLLLPIGLGPVILRCGLFIAALARRCWLLGRGEGVGVAWTLMTSVQGPWIFKVMCSLLGDPCQSRGSI